MMKNSIIVVTKQLLRYADLVITHLSTFKRAFSKLKSHFISKICIRGHPLSTYAPRGRGGGGPKAYVVKEVG